jgi:hypothetical protein
MHSACTPRGKRREQLDSEVEEELRALLARDPTEERVYVSLGTHLLRQRRVEEARSVYEEGCAVAEGANPFIWTALGNLERKVRCCAAAPCRGAPKHQKENAREAGVQTGRMIRPAPNFRGVPCGANAAARWKLVYRAATWP